MGLHCFGGYLRRVFHWKHSVRWHIQNRPWKASSGGDGRRYTPPTDSCHASIPSDRSSVRSYRNAGIKIILINKGLRGNNLEIINIKVSSWTVFWMQVACTEEEEEKEENLFDTQFYGRVHAYILQPFSTEIIILQQPLNFMQYSRSFRKYPPGLQMKSPITPSTELRSFPH